MAIESQNGKLVDHTQSENRNPGIVELVKTVKNSKLSNCQNGEIVKSEIAKTGFSKTENTKCRKVKK